MRGQGERICRKKAGQRPVPSPPKTVTEIAWLGDGLALGDTDALPPPDGLGLTLGLTLALGETDRDTLGLTDGETLPDGLTLGETLGETLGLTDGETDGLIDADGDTL